MALKVKLKHKNVLTLNGEEVVKKVKTPYLKVPSNCRDVGK
jgi:hypothetical protein